MCDHPEYDIDHFVFGDDTEENNIYYSERIKKENCPLLCKDKIFRDNCSIDINPFTQDTEAKFMAELGEYLDIHAKDIFDTDDVRYDPYSVMMNPHNNGIYYWWVGRDCDKNGIPREYYGIRCTYDIRNKKYEFIADHNEKEEYKMSFEYMDEAIHYLIRIKKPIVKSCRKNE